MEEKLFKKIMGPTILLTLTLLILPDFFMKIPLGLMIILSGAIFCVYSIWENENQQQRVKIKNSEIEEEIL